MAIAYSLDEVARTSDDAVVRARFTVATLAWLRFVALISIFAAFLHLAEATNGFRRALAGAAVILALGTFVLLLKRMTNRLTTFIRERARGAATIFVIAQTALLLVYNASAGNQAAMVLAIMYCFVSIGFRLLPAEHVLLHASLAAVAVVTVMAMPIRQLSGFEMVVPPLITNAICLVIALTISRRQRRSIVSDWGERRTSAREQIRMRDELLYARELQLSMLPECAPNLDWADICSISIPATEVGGDYFDYYEGADHVALVCGDVSGHGMASGLVLATMRGGFAILRDSLQNPAGVLRRLHDVVTTTSRRRMLVTVSLVLVDHRTRQATIASAGHPPVLVRRADGSVESIDLYAPPLGVRLPMNIPQRVVDFRPGDVFVLHSDGIYETRSAADETYGLERLAQVVSEKGGGTAEALRDAILQDLAAFRGSVEQDDDVTVVICRIV